MSLSQAGRQAINPITGESRFQQVDYRKSQELDPQKASANSRRPQQFQQQQQQEYNATQERGPYILEQLQDMQARLENDLRRMAKQYNELEREVRLKSSNADSALQIEDLQNKLYQMETRLISEERAKNEIGNKLAQQDQNIRELLHFVKNSQNKDNSGALQLRGMIQERITEETSQMMKEREKSRTLFMEVVRLGEQVERQTESLASLTQQYESRLNGIENKIYNGEKSLVQVAQRGDSGINYLNETSDRIEKRVMNLEQNLLALGKDQLKDHDQINRVDTSNQRLQEELKGMLQSIQQDQQQRLDTRITEVVNRIVMEHEQRVKLMEEMKNSWQLKEQMNTERLQYEREEFREKLSSLEQQQRAESFKQDEAVRQLQTIIETQVTAILNNIQNEETQRYAHEVNLRADLLKIQENIKQENELFKQHQANITEKMTEMIKIEVQNRLSSDVDLKNLTSAIATDIVSDLNQLKDQIDIQNKQMMNQIEVLERESSERAEKLSLYIDEEINKAIKLSSQKYEKLKTMFQRFGEQFTQHLIKYESFQQNIVERIKIIETNYENIRVDFQRSLEQLQQHLLERISEEKNYILQEMSNLFSIIQDKVNKMDEEYNSKFKILKEVVEENHVLLQDKIKLIVDQNLALQQEMKNLIKQLVIEIQELKNNIEIHQKEYEQQIKDLDIKIEQTKEQLLKQQEQLDVLLQKEEELQQNQLKNNDNIEILQTSIDEVKLKYEDMEKVNEILKVEQQKIKAYQDSQDQALENIAQKYQQMSQIQKDIDQNFDQQKNEIKQLEQNINQLNIEINNLREKEIKEQQEYIDKLNQELNVLQDQQLQYDDEQKKTQLNIQELLQKTQHMEDNIKQLSQLPQS